MAATDGSGTGQAAPPPGWWQASDGNWYPPQQAPGYAPPPPGYTAYQYQPAVASNGLATAALVLGIVSICLFWAFGFGVLVGILAIIFGAVAGKRAQELPGAPLAGRAKAGLITGIVGVSVGVLFIIGVAASVDDSIPFSDINTDRSDGWCNMDRYWQDPDC